jgi:ketosteroid isomerase-like protein
MGAFPEGARMSQADVPMLRAAYDAFNARDIDAAVAAMAPDVAWPRAFKGGFAHGHDGVRAYWTEQWTEIDGRILVKVHQVVRDLAGAVLFDGFVGHRYTFDGGLIRTMDVLPWDV